MYLLSSCGKEPSRQSACISPTICLVSRDQQAGQASDLLEADPSPSDTYQQLKAWLMHLYESDQTTRVRKLYHLPPLSGQRWNNLLTQMWHLRTKRGPFSRRWFIGGCLRISRTESRIPLTLTPLRRLPSGQTNRRLLVTNSVAPVEEDVVVEAAIAKPQREVWKGKKHSRKRKYRYPLVGGLNQTAGSYPTAVLTVLIVLTLNHRPMHILIDHSWFLYIYSVLMIL